MTHTYDWSKLDACWQFDGADSLIDRKWDCYYSVKELESGVAVRGKIGTNVPAALDQLAKCRIPAPELHDWSRLEGSGWRNAAGDVYITDGTWCFWYTSGVLQNPYPFAVSDAENAYDAAKRLVAKCRRDWRDEVKQACEGIDGLAELYLMVPSEYRLRASDSPHWFALAFKSDRTFGLIDGVQTLEWVLKLSLIIERLKKLGWREA